jgi:hypothetical protein
MTLKVWMLTPLYIAAGIVTAPFRGPNGASTADRHIENYFIRAYTAALTAREVQFIWGTSTEVFNKWRLAHPGEPLKTEVVSEEVKLHWIGDAGAKWVILFIHGTSSSYILMICASCWL